MATPRRRTGVTPVRNLRVEESVWRAAQRRARADGDTLTEAVVRYLKRYGKDFREDPEESPE